jgi:hypothetical protein
MKSRSKILIALFVLATTSIAAQGFDMDAFFRTSIGPNQKTADAILLPMRVGLGASYDYELKPFISPGLKAQIGFSPLGGMMNEKLIMFDFGCRLFDGIRFGHFELEPFLGYTLTAASANGANYSAGRIDAGIEAIFGIFGLECAYAFPGSPLIIPAFGSITSNIPVIDANGALRIGLSYHLKKR